LKGSWGRYGNEIDAFCGCCNPADLAVLPDGRVVTAEKGLPRVKVYRRDGTLESVVAAPEQLSPQPPALDVAVDAAGQVYVLDPPARVVKVYAPLGGGQ
jgi:sugar lactone lactonase YvrE